MLAVFAAHATPAQVTTGTYLTKIQNLDFKENSYTLDFYLWFRWKPEGVLLHYRPLESFELVNGAIQSRSGVVSKTVGDTRYVAVRVAATMVENWELEKYPFDRHRMNLFIEDSTLSRDQMEFVPDTANSGLGDELDLAGWKATNFQAHAQTKTYRSNYGDPELPPQARSEFSRYAASVDIERQTFGTAIKLLSTVLLAAAVSFVAFLVKPSDLDARFGMGVGALFAVAASAYIASSSVPDSGVMTTADFMHMVALMFIFCSLLISAVCLKLEVSGRETLAFSIDRVCAVVLPLLFYGWSAIEVGRSLR